MEFFHPTAQDLDQFHMILFDLIDSHNAEYCADPKLVLTDLKEKDWIIRDRVNSNLANLFT